MDAYSQPTTPPPRTASEDGSRSILRISSESCTSGSSKGMEGGRNGDEPGGDQEGLSREPARSASVRNLDGAPVDEATVAVDLFDAVCLQVADHPLGLELAHRVLARDQLGNRQAGFDLDRHAVEIELAIAGQEERGLAEGLGRQRTRVHRRPARLRLSLDDRNALAEVGGLCGPLLTGRPGAYHDQIESIGVA